MKLADLGAARSVLKAEGGAYIAKRDHAPFRWMAPEALKEAKAKRDAIAKGTGQAPSEVAFKDDGSFLERARAQIEAQKAKEAEAPPKPA